MSNNEAVAGHRKNLLSFEKRNHYSTLQYISSHSPMEFREFIESGLSPDEVQRMSESLTRHEEEPEACPGGVNGIINDHVASLNTRKARGFQEVAGEKIYMSRGRIRSILSPPFSGTEREKESALHVIHQRAHGLARIRQETVLQANGFLDRVRLENALVGDFCQSDFFEFGDARTFLSAVLGREIIRPRREDIRAIPDALGMPLREREEIYGEYVAVLEQNGYHTPWEVMMAESAIFQNQSFGRFGKGRSLYFALTGKVLHSGMNSGHLQEIAESVHFPIHEESEMKAYYRTMLEAAGFPTFENLITANCQNFASHPIGHLRSGRHLYMVLFQSSSGRAFTNAHLGEIGEFLGLRRMTNEELQGIVAEKGYGSRIFMEDANITDFLNTEFPPFGKGRALYRFVTGDDATFTNLSKEHLSKIADALGFPPITAEEMKTEQRRVLRKSGFSNWNSLADCRPKEFTRRSFGRFGQGRAFYHAVTGTIIKGPFLRCHLRELADFFFPLL